MSSVFHSMSALWRILSQVWWACLYWSASNISGVP